MLFWLNENVPYQKYSIHWLECVQNTVDRKTGEISMHRFVFLCFLLYLCPLVCFIIFNYNMETIVITRLCDSYQANILKDVLNNEGIECFLIGETLNSVLSKLQGFEIDVMVYEQDYAKALGIYKKGFCLDNQDISEV